MAGNNAPINGDYYDSDGRIRNLLENGEQSTPSPKDYMTPWSGNFYAQDGTVHNLQELFQCDGTGNGVPGKDGKDGKDGRDGNDGKDGVSPEITVVENTCTSFRLRIKTATDVFETPNLKGDTTGGCSTTEQIIAVLDLFRDVENMKQGLNTVLSAVKDLSWKESDA